MIKVNGLTKYYGNKPAAKDITFEVNKGEVFGLLGTNGAGKSTTIKMLCGLLKPTRGSIMIGDIDLNRMPLKAKSMMGYLPENPLIYDKLTGAETLELIGRLRKLSNDMIEQRVKYYAQTLDLGEQIYHEVGTYSKGMRQKLAIAMTLIHDPEMVLLDEPASGLDPRYTKLLKDWIKNLSANGRTVLLSTHIIEMAETLCDRIGIIDQGKLMAIGTVNDIQTSTGVRNLEDAFIRLIST
ncbi:MAG TPA: ABC transporter ATP-binding protein [Candidatus Poseidoniia archaeon]|jgi:ABC-2 type transport system ATP-binding protein|nr:ABC transporter ATP-binding protein [Candidatus Poseidoniia archaeon]|tara:strand:+ start:4694 stop:5410 length:717 start_codon:yes stop_codon:yes gene_type:complete